MALSDNCIYRLNLGSWGAQLGTHSNEQPTLELFAGSAHPTNEPAVSKDGNRIGEAVFIRPAGMDATNDERGRLWIADEGAHSIRVVNGDIVKSALGGPDASPDGLLSVPLDNKGQREARDGVASEAVLCRPISVLYMFSTKTIVIAERGRKTLRLLNLKTMTVSSIALNLEVPSVDVLRIYSSQLLHCPQGPRIIRVLDTRSATVYNVDLVQGHSTRVDSNLLPLATYLRDDKITSLWYGKHTNWMQWDLGVSEFDGQSTRTADSPQDIQWLHEGPRSSWMFYIPRHNVFVGYSPADRGLKIMPNFMKTKFPNTFPAVAGSPMATNVLSTNTSTASPSSNPFDSQPPPQYHQHLGMQPPTSLAASAPPQYPMTHSFPPPPTMPNQAQPNHQFPTPMAQNLSQSQLPPGASYPSHASVLLPPNYHSQPLKPNQPAVSIDHKIGPDRMDLSSLLTSPVPGDLEATHGLSGRVWRLHKQVLNIHLAKGDSEGLDKILRLIKGTIFPVESVATFIDYLYCKPVALSSDDLRTSCHLASHVVHIWEELQLENLPYLMNEIGTTIVRHMTPDIACSALFDLWADDAANWKLEDALVQILASFVRGTCRQKFLGLATESELPSKRLVPLVSNVSALLDPHPLQPVLYTPTLPEVRLVWSKTRTDLMPTDPPADPPESFLWSNNDYVFGFDEKSDLSHCWIVVSGVYLWPRWTWFRQRIAFSGATPAERVFRMPLWVNANILLSILNSMHLARAPFVLTELDAVVLLEHARELDLVDENGAPVGCFVRLLQNCFEASFPPLSERNILSHYSKYFKLNITPKLDELVNTLVMNNSPFISNLAELEMEQIVDLFSRIKKRNAELSTRN